MYTFHDLIFLPSCLSYVFLTNSYAYLQTLTKEYSKLPSFENTELLDSLEKADHVSLPYFVNAAATAAYSSPNAVEISDLVDLYTMKNPFRLSDDPNAPFGPHDDAKEMFRDFVNGLAKDDKAISGWAKDGPKSSLIYALFCHCRDKHVDYLNVEMQHKLRARAVMRLHLAITRQNDLKSKLIGSNGSSSTKMNGNVGNAGNAQTLSARSPSPSKTARRRSSGSIGSASSHTVNERDSSSSERPLLTRGNVFSRDKMVQPVQAMDDAAALSDLMMATGMTVSLATVRGLEGTAPAQHAAVVRQVLESIIQLLVPFTHQLSPIPRVCKSKENALPVVEENEVLRNCAVVMHWDANLSNNQLAFNETNTTASRPGSVSSYPACLAPLTSDLCSFSVVLTEGKISSNWLTIGLCKSDFSNNASDGFGRGASSW
jgi:hypothetical protein